MAQFEKLIPFILKWETGVPKRFLSEPLPQLFERARRTGWADVPDDKGGPTLCGVTIATYTSYCRRKGYPRPTLTRLRNMPFSHWLDIMKGMFWDRWKADNINNQAIANALVDWVWTSGKPGIVVPQRILGVKADGVVGPNTLAAVNGADARTLFDHIRHAHTAFVHGIVARNPRERKFLRGWERRIDSITFNGFDYDV